MFDEFKLEIAEPLEMTARPCTVRPVSVPKEVMFDCEGFVTDPAIGTAPTMFAEFMFEIPDPFEAIKRPWMFSPVRVPSDVMLDWTFPETETATFAKATFPTILDP
jgi:hypothetical protein